MDKAKYINKTTVRGVRKHRFECHKCKHRFNRSNKYFKRSKSYITTCPECKTDQWLIISKINKKILSWLMYTPSSDCNFKSALEKANIETIEEVLKDKNIGKCKRLVLERKLRKLRKI